MGAVRDSTGHVKETLNFGYLAIDLSSSYFKLILILGHIRSIANYIIYKFHMQGH